MKHSLFLLLFLALATVQAPAELGHVFAPLKPEELARMQGAMPHDAAKPAKPRKLLVFYLTEGFVHASIPYGNEAIKELGEKTGAYTADFSEDMSVFTPAKLDQYDAIVFNNTTGLKFVDPAARQALLDYVKKGRGIVGIHSATDNFPTWPEGQELIGGKFDGHPWHSGDIEAVNVEDPANPILAPFAGKGFWVNDEVYQMKAPYDRNQVRVLLSLDMSKLQNARAPKLVHRTDNDFPICWIKQADGGGRVFYCSLGHNASIFWTPQFLQLYLNGIQYALGDLPADATPSGKISVPPVAALAPETPDPLNPKPPKPAPAPKPTAINGAVPPLVSMILASEIAAKSAPSDADADSDASEPKASKSDFPASVAVLSSDPLGDGLKAISAYDYGTDRTNIVAFDDYVRSLPSGSRGKVEAALLPLLNQPGISLAAKEYVCRWLAIIGSDASIPALQKLIDDPKLSHLAVSALLSMDTPAAKSVLSGSLDGAPAALRPAIIGAIGRAGMAEEVPALAKILTVNDADQVAAALDALGAIGSPEALAALRAANVPAPLEATHQWALIQAALHALKTTPSGRGDARAVFASLIKSGAVSSLRVAAAQGYILADPSGAWAVISPLLQDKDEKVRLNLATQLGELPPDAIPQVVTLLPSLDPAVQVVILNSLAQTQRAGIEPVLKAGLASSQPEVHLAAIAGYGTANLPDSASVLLPFLSGDESATATASLELLSQPDTSATLKADAAQAQDPAKAALLTVLLAQMDHSAIDLFFSSTGDKDAQVADIGFKGVSILADGSHLERLIGLFSQIKNAVERKSLESALARCALLATDKDTAADKLLGAIPAASPQDRPAFIMAIATMHSPKGTAGLQTLLQSTSVDDRKAVIRALSSAHDPAADKLLLYAASHATEPSEKVLALRGFLDSIRAQTLFDTEKVQAYVDAWPLAIRPEEQQDILDAFKHMKSVRAQKAYQKILATIPKSSATPEPSTN